MWFHEDGAAGGSAATSDTARGASEAEAAALRSMAAWPSGLFKTQSFFPRESDLVRVRVGVVPCSSRLQLWALGALQVPLS